MRELAMITDVGNSETSLYFTVGWSKAGILPRTAFIKMSLKAARNLVEEGMYIIGYLEGRMCVIDVKGSAVEFVSLFWPGDGWPLPN